MKSPTWPWWVTPAPTALTPPPPPALAPARRRRARSFRVAVAFAFGRAARLVPRRGEVGDFDDQARWPADEPGVHPSIEALRRRLALFREQARMRDGGELGEMEDVICPRCFAVNPETVFVKVSEHEAKLAVPAPIGCDVCMIVTEKRKQ